MSVHVEQELIAYLDGELDEHRRIRVEAHLEQCPRCVAELERLRALNQELDATFEAALTPIGLPAAADQRIRDRLTTSARPPLGWLFQRWGVAVQVLLAVAIAFYVLSTYHAVRLPPAPITHETLVLGQEQLSADSQAALRVIVRDSEEAKPIEGAQVAVLIGRSPGVASIVYTGLTDSNGTALVSFDVPADLTGQASLVVETTTVGGQDRIVRPINITRNHRLLLSSDKPVYRPGDTVHMRILALDALELRPATRQEIQFTIYDADGDLIVQRAVTSSEFGIAAADYDLPADAVEGQYALRARLGDTISERSVTIGEYELPAFAVVAETDRNYYAPGDRVTGEIRAEYFHGEPVAGGQVAIRGYTGDLQEGSEFEIVGQTDETGLFQFEFRLPTSFGQDATDRPAQFDLELGVTDTAGQIVGIRRFVPVAAQPILINAIPESGLLKPGIENVIYVLTSYPDGQPAETTLTVEVEGDEYTLTTGPYGLAEFHYRPPKDVIEFDFTARDAEGLEGSTTLTFETDQERQVLLLRAEQAAYEVGDTLRLETFVAGVDQATGGVVYLDLLRSRQTVANLSAPVESGRAVFAVDLDSSMVGTLELHAYLIAPDGSMVEDTRLVVVDAPRQVRVTVAADQERYQPGDTAHIQFQTAITATEGASATPVQSALGLGVVDASVYALEEEPPGFVRAYFLLEETLQERRYKVQGFDGLALLEAEDDLRVAQDLAARAAWAGASATFYSLSAQSTAEEQVQVAFPTALPIQLGLALLLLPSVMGIVVWQGLQPAGVLRQALRRVGTGIAVSFAVSPVVGGVMWLLWTILRAGAPALVLASMIALLIAIAIHGWRRRDTRVQAVTGLLAAYLAIGASLVYLAAQGGDLHGLLLALIVVTFLLAVGSLAVLGQGLVIEGWSATGWATTTLAVLLVVLVIYLPFVPALASNLTRTVGNPALYAGPAGWLGGCAAPTREMPEPLAPTEAPVPAPTGIPPEEVEPPATPVQVPTPEPTPVEPFPLRQVFPETLYWNPEVVTDEAGRLTLDLQLADSLTAWRLTALASTRDGELGVATYDIVVFQDFFVDLDLPTSASVADTVTVSVTAYNYLERSQTIELVLTPADWYKLVTPPEPIQVAPNSAATTTFTILVEQPGQHDLQIQAVGDQISDAISKPIVVE